MGEQMQTQVQAQTQPHAQPQPQQKQKQKAQRQRAKQTAAARVPVVVQVVMPHVTQWGHSPLQRLTYRGDARLRPGDQVVCPPTRLSKGWMRGVVVEIGDDSYTGETRVVTPIGRAKARIQREGSRA